MRASNLQYLEGLTRNAATIWFAFWAIRRKYELGYPLDRTGHLIRWICVGAGFAMALLRAPELKAIRIIGGVLALIFLCWPNCVSFIPFMAN